MRMLKSVAPTPRRVEFVRDERGAGISDIFGPNLTVIRMLLCARDTHNLQAHVCFVSWVLRHPHLTPHGMHSMLTLRQSCMCWRPWSRPAGSIDDAAAEVLGIKGERVRCFSVPHMEKKLGYTLHVSATAASCPAMLSVWSQSVAAWPHVATVPLTFVPAPALPFCRCTLTFR